MSYSGSVSDATIALVPASGTSGAKTITIPNANGTFCLTTTCLSSIFATNFNTTAVSTSTPFWAQGGVFASSTTAFPTLAVSQLGAGPAATFLGGNVGIGSSTPWALTAVASSTWGGVVADYNRPLFAVATSSDSFGQLFHIMATSSTEETSGSTFSSAANGVRVVIGSLLNTFDQLFINGSFASSWQNSFCDSFSLSNTVSVNTDFICGFINFQKATVASLGPILPSNSNYGLDGATLSVSSGSTADGAVVRAGRSSPLQLASTTPRMEVIIGGPAAISSTTQYFVGFSFAPTLSNEPVSGCYFAATSSANWRAICTTGTGTTTVDTGIATSTPFVKFRIALNANSAVFYAKSSPYVGLTE